MGKKRLAIAAVVVLLAVGLTLFAFLPVDSEHGTSEDKLRDGAESEPCPAGVRVTNVSDEYDLWMIRVGCETGIEVGDLVPVPGGAVRIDMVSTGYAAGVFVPRTR